MVAQLGVVEKQRCLLADESLDLGTPAWGQVATPCLRVPMLTLMALHAVPGALQRCRLARVGHSLGLRHAPAAVRPGQHPGAAGRR